MTKGMADIIAAHSHVGVDPESWNLGAQARWCCHDCGALETNPHPDTTKPIWHGIHLAEELAQARYGLLDPLAAALADPEGHALVKAIHDRKAGA